MIEKIFVQLVSVIIMLNLSTIGSMMPNTLCISSDFSLTSRSLFPMYGKEFFQEDYIIHANIETFFRKGHMGQGISIDPETSPNGHRRRIFKGIGRFSKKANSLFRNIATELTGKSVVPPEISSIDRHRVP